MTPLKLFLAYQLTIYMQWTSIWCTAAIISLDWHLNLNQGTTVAYVGDTVLWTWTDEYAHTVQSIGQPSFTSSITKTGSGSQHSYHFTVGGEYFYNCAIHGNSMTGIISVQTLSAPTSMPTSGLTSYAPSTIPSLSPLSAAPTAEFLTTSPTGGPVSSIPTGMPTQTISQNPTILASTNKPTTVSLDSNQPTINPMYGNKTLEWSMGSGAYDNVFISVGDTVRWIWMDSLPHNVYSTDNGFESSPTINEQGYIYKVTFCIPGSYPFKCTIHPLQMMGVVVVSANIGDKINENGNGWTKSNTILLATLLTILVLFHVVCTLVYLSRESSVCLSMLYINPPQPPEMDCNNIIDLYKNG